MKVLLFLRCWPPQSSFLYYPLLSPTEESFVGLFYFSFFEKKKIFLVQEKVSLNSHTMKKLLFTFWITASLPSPISNLIKKNYFLLPLLYFLTFLMLGTFKINYFPYYIRYVICFGVMIQWRFCISYCNEYWEIQIFNIDAFESRN